MAELKGVCLHGQIKDGMRNDALFDYIGKTWTYVFRFVSIEDADEGKSYWFCEPSQFMSEMKKPRQEVNLPGSPLCNPLRSPNYDT